MLEITILSVGTLLLLVLGLMSAIFVAYMTYSFSGRIFKGLLLGVAIVGILNVLLTGRILRFGDSGLDVSLDAGVGSTLFGKLLLVILVGVAFSICVAWWMWRFGNKRPLQRYSATAIIEVNKMTLAFVIYFIAFSLLPLAFAPRFEFHVSLVYPLFVWLALLLMLRVSTIDPVLVIRQVLGLIVLASLSAAVLLPTLALQPGYVGLIPGFDMRLWGVAASANTLGSVAGILLILQVIEEPRNPLRHHLLTACSVIALVLTQSKSAMAGALLGVAVVFFWRIWRGNTLYPASYTRIMAGSTVLIFAGVLLLALVWALVEEPNMLYALERHFNPTAIAGVESLTGRIYIWDYAIRRGLESPFFGHGLAMWDTQVRLSTGMTGAVHAHNLYLQAFSRSGFIGLTSLLVVVLLLVRNSFRAASLTKGGSLALLVMFMVRSITEVPIQPNAIIGGEFFAFMALLVYVIDRGAAPLKSSVAVCATEAGPGQLKGV